VALKLLLLSSAFTSRMSSAIWQQCHQLNAITAAPSCLDCGQLLTICDVIWRLPQGYVGCCKAPLLSTVALVLVGVPSSV